MAESEVDFTPAPYHYKGGSDVEPTGGGGAGADDPGYGAAIQSGVIGGTPLGRAASAGVEALESYLPKWARAPGDVPQELEGGIGDRFSASYQSVGERMRAADTAHPYVSELASLAPASVGGGAGGFGRAALTGAAYGAGTAVNQAESLEDVPLTAAIGAGLGGIGGGATHMLFPGQSAARQAILDASGRTGIPVPKYIASPSYLPQRLGQLYQSAPVLEGPLRHATEESIKGMGNVAQGLGQGISKETAGAAVKEGVKNWVGPVSSTEANQIFGAANRQMNPWMQHPLTNTMQVFDDIAGRRAAYGDALTGPTASLINGAAQVQGGLTYSAMKDLRTRLGDLNSGWGAIGPKELSDAENARLYGAMSNDLNNAALRAGGPQGLQLHQDAAARYAQIADNRARLTKILGGSQALRSPEGVYGAMQKIAGTGSEANIDLLRRVKASTTPASWAELGQGMIAQMGRDPKNLDAADQPIFSGARFLTDYSKISPAAKDELFGRQGAPTGPWGGSLIRQNLDDLQTIAQAFQRNRALFGNPSGTGHVAAGLGAIAVGEQAWEHRDEIMEHPFATVAAIGTPWLVGKYLASPAGSSAFKNYFLQYLGHYRNPSPQTMSRLQAAAQRMAAVGTTQLGAGVLNPQQFLQ